MEEYFASENKEFRMLYGDTMELINDIDSKVDMILLTLLISCQRVFLLVLMELGKVLTILLPNFRPIAGRTHSMVREDGKVTGNDCRGATRK